MPNSDQETTQDEVIPDQQNDEINVFQNRSMNSDDVQDVDEIKKV